MAVLKNTTIEDCTITGEVEFYDATIHLDSDQVQHITLKTVGNELQIRNEDDTAFGTLHADSFIGDGSQLTNIDSGPNSTDELNEGTTNLYYSDERVDDRVNTLVQAGTNLTKSYDDSSDTLTLDVENNLSSFNNDVGFITDYSVTQSDVTQYESALTITESQISDLNHFSGSYNDLSDVPTTLSAFTNDVGYLTSVSYTDLIGSPSDVITAGQDLVWNGSTLDHDALHGSELQEITYGENLNQGDPILLYDDSGTVKARKINVTLDYDVAADIQGTDTFNENGEANVTFASDKYIIVSFVKDVNGTNYIGIRIYESDDGILSLVSETITDVETGGEIRLVDISDTSFVVSTVHNQTVYVFAGKILSNGSVDTGQKKAADKGDERPALARINETSAVLATSSNSAKAIYLSKIDVSGTSVTVNTASTVGTSTRAASRMWITDLSDTKFVISVSDTRTGSNYGVCIVADRSSNTFTFGSKSTFLAEDLGQDYSFATKTLSTTEFTIGYIKNDGSAQVIVNSVSGTTITYGSEQELSPASENNLKINLKSFPDSSSRFLAITSKEPVLGTYEVDAYNGLPDLNNQTVNFGNTPTNLYNDSDNPDYVDICGFAAARLVALFESGSGIAKTVSARYFTSDERGRFAGFAAENGTTGEVKPTYLLFQYADLFTGLDVDTFYYLDTSLNLVTTDTGFLVGFSVDLDTIAITKTKSN